MPHVFVSYSHDDTQIAHALAQSLEQFGIKVWIDYAELRVGDSLITRLRNGIDTATHLIALVSRNSIKSSWVQKELEIASIREIDGKKIRVLPAVIDEVELPGFLIGKYYAQFHSNCDNTLAIARLIRAIDEYFEPIDPPWYPGEQVRNPYLAPMYRQLHLAEINNTLALKIVEYAATFSSELHNQLMPEHLHRYDASMTYAVDAADYDLYEKSKAEFNRRLEEYAPYQYLLSPQGILMRQAVRLFLESARAGDPEALWNLGWRFELGQGVPKDQSRAVYYWRLAAKSGHDPATEKLHELGISSDNA